VCGDVFGVGSKVFVAGVYRGGFSENMQKPPPRPTEPRPAGSKTDLLLAKAQPISDGGSTSVITYLRRG